MTIALLRAQKLALAAQKAPELLQPHCRPSEHRERIEKWNALEREVIKGGQTMRDPNLDYCPICRVMEVGIKGTICHKCRIDPERFQVEVADPFTPAVEEFIEAHPNGVLLEGYYVFVEELERPLTFDEAKAHLDSIPE